jgi:hypothetical protein
VDTTLDRPQGLSGRFEEAKHLWTFLSIKLRFLGRPSRSIVRRTDWVLLDAFQYCQDIISTTGLLFSYPSSPITTRANRLLSGSACFHSAQNLLPSSLLSKNMHIMIYRTKFCSLFCTGLKSGLPHRQRAFQTRVLSKIFGPQSEGVIAHLEAAWSVFTKHYPGDQIKEDEMGCAFGTHGQKINTYMVFLENLME